MSPITELTSDALSVCSDGTLLADVACGGREAAFEELVDRHSQAVLNVCCRQLGDGHDAEDAAQAVFLVLWKKASSLQRRTSVAGWLHHVARNVCRNARRARRVRQQHEQDAAGQGDHPSAPGSEWDQIKEFLDDEVDRLPERYRLPIILFHLEGRSQEEIAALLATKRATVAQRLSRGREMLRSRLTRRGIALGVAALATTLSANVCKASVPATFVASTTKAAGAFAAGKVAVSGVLSAKTAALANGVIKVLALGKMNTVASLLLTVAIVTGGSVAVVETVGRAGPQVIHAAGTSHHDVQTAINDAQDGDTVLIPAGSSTWTDTVLMDGKGITLMGSGFDKTTITAETAANKFQRLLHVNGKQDAPFRISGIGFRSGDKQSWKGLIYIRGNCRNWRVDHCGFEIERNVGVDVSNTNRNYGVIDHCRFEAPLETSAIGVRVWGEGDASWQQPLTLGTEHALYVEDCQFNWKTQYSGALVAADGARYVFRHNQVGGTWVSQTGMDSSRDRATFSGEIYGNDFRSTGNNVWTAANILGGTGVVFDNTVSDAYGSFCVLQNSRSEAVNRNRMGDRGIADGSNPLDGNQEANGYPCCDQVGRTTDSGLGTLQQHSPLYFWANRLDDGSSVAIRVQGAGQHIQSDRDYIARGGARPDYSPYVYPHPLIRIWDEQPATLE